jgi:hypothetical protein
LRSDQVQGVRDLFLNTEKGEKRSTFDERINSVLSSDSSSCDVVYSEDRILATISVRTDGNDRVVDLLRVVGRSALTNSLAEQLVFMLRDTARRARATRLIVTDGFRSRHFDAPLKRDGFVDAPAGVVAATPARCQTRVAWADQLRREPLVRGAAQYLQALSLCERDAAPSAAETAEFERLLWPGKISDAPYATYLVPIRQLWASRLFGWPTALESRPTILGLSRELIYYRAPRPAVVTAPARVLWYATQGTREPVAPGVFACSRLEEVVADAPDVLYARFKHLGVYEHSNVTEAAKAGIAQALRFADTELFDSPVGLDRLREIARQNCQTLHLRSPQKIKPELFAALYREGALEHAGR